MEAQNQTPVQQRVPIHRSMEHHLIHTTRSTIYSSHSNFTLTLTLIIISPYPPTPSNHYPTYITEDYPLIQKHTLPLKYQLNKHGTVIYNHDFFTLLILLEVDPPTFEFMNSGFRGLCCTYMRIVIVTCSIQYVHRVCIHRYRHSIRFYEFHFTLGLYWKRFGGDTQQLR